MHDDLSLCIGKTRDMFVNKLFQHHLLWPEGHHLWESGWVFSTSKCNLLEWDIRLNQYLTPKATWPSQRKVIRDLELVVTDADIHQDDCAFIIDVMARSHAYHFRGWRHSVTCWHTHAEVFSDIPWTKPSPPNCFEISVEKWQLHQRPRLMLKDSYTVLYM